MENIQNDVIDLKELFGVISKRKKLIYSITILITLLAIAYAYLLAKPVYQVQTMIEVGKINETPLDTTLMRLKQKLEYLYGVTSKKKRDYPRVKSITVGKKSKSVFSM